MPPVWSEGGSWSFALGTDPLGRDMLSRLLFGARYSFLVGIVVVLVSASGGILIGLVAGFSPRWLDAIIMRVMDIILAFPSLLLALVLVAIFGPTLLNAMIAIAIVLQPHYVRLTRASVMNERAKEYVVSARVAGAGTMRLMFSTVLPNCLAPIIVQAALSFSTAILDAAALGFLGMGAQPPTPEWGTMLAEAREFHPARLVGGHVSGPRHPDHGPGNQFDGRRAAGRSRPEAEAKLIPCRSFAFGTLRSNSRRPMVFYGRWTGSTSM